MKTTNLETVSEGGPSVFDTWISYGFHILVIGLPLIVSYSLSNDQFDLPKLTFMRLVSIFLIIGFAAKLCTEQTQRRGLTAIHYLVLVFLALILVSTSFSVHLPTSIFGKYKRYQGLLTYLNYGLLFFLSSYFFRSIQTARIIARSMILAASMVSAYGLIQYFGWDFFGWALPFESGRSFSTFGNPVLLGGFLIIALPISLGLTFSATTTKEQMFYTVSSMLVFSCLITTFSRASWFAALLIASLFVVSVAVRLGRWRQTALLLGCLLLIMISLIAYSSFRQAQTSADVKERLTSSFLVEGSSTTRWQIWTGALFMLTDRPLLGFGPDCFRLVFRRYQTLTYKRLVGETTIADDAHNYFLQLASTAGLPATFVFAATLIVFLVLMHQFLVRQKADRQYIFLLGLILSVVGYSFYLIFGISIVGSAALFWTIMGMATGLSTVQRTNYPAANSGSIARILVFAIAILVLVPLAVLSAFPFVADYYFSRANDLARSGQYREAIHNYNQAIFFFPVRDLYYYQVASLDLKKARASEEIEYYRRAVNAAKSAKRISPLETDNYFLLATIYSFGSRRLNSGDYPNAVDELKTVIRLEPFSARAHYLLGTIYIAQGADEQAVEAFKRAVHVVPDFEDAHLHLGVVYEEQGKDKDAVRSYEKVLSLNPDNSAAQEALRRLMSDNHP